MEIKSIYKIPPSDVNKVIDQHTHDNWIFDSKINTPEDNYNLWFHRNGLSGEIKCVDRILEGDVDRIIIQNEHSRQWVYDDRVEISKGIYNVYFHRSNER